MTVFLDMLDTVNPFWHHIKSSWYCCRKITMAVAVQGWNRNGQRESDSKLYWTTPFVISPSNKSNTRQLWNSNPMPRNKNSQSAIYCHDMPCNISRSHYLPTTLRRVLSPFPWQYEIIPTKFWWCSYNYSLAKDGTHDPPSWLLFEVLNSLICINTQSIIDFCMHVVVDR